MNMVTVLLVKDESDSPHLAESCYLRKCGYLARSKVHNKRFFFPLNNERLFLWGQMQYDVKTLLFF